MKVEFHTIVQDPWAVKRRWEPAEEHCTEDVDARVEGPLADGPSSRRLATVDPDPGTAVRVIRSRHGNTHFRSYSAWGPDGVEDPAYLRTNVFGLALKTLGLYEEVKALARPVRWAFRSRQLKLRVRDGEGRDVHYDPESGSLSFPSFDSPVSGSGKVHTALSRDIVCHEVGHAILDGLAPDLLNSWAPESRALHEAVADLSALWMTLECAALRRAIIESKGGIGVPSVLNALGEQFARTDRNETLPAIRSLLTAYHRLRDAEKFKGPNGDYELSLVFSGAVYRLMDRWFKQKSTTCSDELQCVSVLKDAADHWRRMVIRGIDLLPTGEVGFAAAVGAILTADRLRHPGRSASREWFNEEMVACEILPSTDSFPTIPPVRVDDDVKSVIQNVSAAECFVQKHRTLLRGRAGAKFEVRTRRFRLSPKGRPEGILKVRWEFPEPPGEKGLHKDRLVREGTTVVFDIEQREILAVISSLADLAPEDRERQRSGRDRMQALLTAAEDSPTRERPAAGLRQVRGAVRPKRMSALLVCPFV